MRRRLLAPLLVCVSGALAANRAKALVDTRLLADTAEAADSAPTATTGTQTSSTKACTPQVTMDTNTSSPSCGGMNVLSDEQSSIRTQLLLVVSDHGTGSSTYLESMGTHECAFNLHEPLTNAFDPGDSGFAGALATRTNEKLDKRIRDDHTQKGKWEVETPLPASTYDCLNMEGMGTYLMRVARHVCGSMPADLAAKCGGSCVAVAKVFPAYLGGDSGWGFNTARVYDPKDPYGLGLVHPEAFTIWNKTMASMAKMANTQMSVLTRDEADRALSCWRRFTYHQDWFNCDVKRAGKQTVFEASARQITGAKVVNIEDCRSEEGARACIQTPFSLFGLNASEVNLQPMTKPSEQHENGVQASCEKGGWLMAEGKTVKPVPGSKLKTEMAKADEKFADRVKWGSLFKEDCSFTVSAPTKTVPEATALMLGKQEWRDPYAEDFDDLEPLANQGYGLDDALQSNMTWDTNVGQVSDEEATVSNATREASGEDKQRTRKADYRDPYAEDFDDLEPLANQGYGLEDNMTITANMTDVEGSLSAMRAPVHVPTIPKGKKMWFAHVHKAAGKEFMYTVTDVVNECPELSFVHIPFVAAFGQGTSSHGSAKTKDYTAVQKWWFNTNPIHPRRGGCNLWSTEDHLGQLLPALYDGRDWSAWVNGTDGVAHEPALLTMYREPVDRCKSHWDYMHIEWEQKPSTAGKAFPFGDSEKEHQKFVDAKCTNFYSAKFSTMDASLKTADAIADWYDRKVAFWGLSEQYATSLCLFYYQIGSSKFDGCGCKGNSSSLEALESDNAPQWLQNDRHGTHGSRAHTLKLSDSELTSINQVDVDLYAKLKVGFEQRVQAVEQTTGCAFSHTQVLAREAAGPRKSRVRS